MANTSALSGLAPVKYLNGAPWNGAVNIYCILAADTNAFAVGDIVKTQANASVSGIPAVTLGTAGAAARGVIVALGTALAAPQGGGPYINPANLNVTNRPSGAATCDYFCAVVDDPQVLFEVQEGGVGSVLTTTSLNRNVNINAGTRSDTMKVSGMYLDNNTVNTTSTLNLQILRPVPRPDNQFGAASQKWLVRINNHEFRAGITSL